MSPENKNRPNWLSSSSANSLKTTSLMRGAPQTQLFTELPAVKLMRFAHYGRRVCRPCCLFLQQLRPDAKSPRVMCFCAHYFVTKFTKAPHRPQRKIRRRRRTRTQRTNNRREKKTKYTNEATHPRHSKFMYLRIRTRNIFEKAHRKQSMKNVS